MTEKMNIEDIEKTIYKVLDNPDAKNINSIFANLLNLINPTVGAVAQISNDFLSTYNNFKLACLLRGLASNLCIEKRLNELYNYVESSSEKAICVANLFKQTINAECPKACVIYGLILASHLNSNTNFSHEELIICKALENATDFDLNNFKEIMDKYTEDTLNGKRVIFTNDISTSNTYTITCDWCIYNRIFVSSLFEVDEANEELDTKIYYYIKKPAYILLNYIKMARQTWDYGNFENSNTL